MSEHRTLREAEGYAVSATFHDPLLPGTRVLAWPGSRDGSPLVTRTRGEVWSLGDGTRVVAVEGHAGGIALTHVDVLPAHPDTPAPTGQPLTDDEREALGDACDAEREALGDACDAAYDFGDAWVRFTRNGNESMLLPVVERIVAAREQAAADRARAEAEVRWMKVAVMRDGEAIREAQADAYDKGVEAGQAWGRRVNAAWPRNPYCADALAAEDTPAPDPATITAWLAGADERAKEPQTPDDREEVRARLDAPEVTVEDVAEGLRALADEFREHIATSPPPEAYSRGWVAACGRLLWGESTPGAVLASDWLAAREAAARAEAWDEGYDAAAWRSFRRTDISIGRADEADPPNPYRSADAPVDLPSDRLASGSEERPTPPAPREAERDAGVEHVVHVTAEPVAEDVVWCDECEEWVAASAPESAAENAPREGDRDV